jgi:hypothetical protein
LDCRPQRAAGIAPVTHSSTGNLLLWRLSRSDFEALGSLERISLPLRFAQENPNEPIRYVYFPESGLSSKIALTDNGERLEVGVIGREGPGHPRPLP